MSELEFTGERVVPGLVDPNLFNEHLARYRFAAQFAADARVLDAGCGTGYGSAELATAASVMAMDISAEAIAHARLSFATPRVHFLQGTCEALPFADASFDLVTAFEVIEHLEHWQQMLSEARRVLRPAGVLLVSTPNIAWYGESRAGAGPNPYHVHEFEYREFAAALQAVFPHVHLWTQNHSETIAFIPDMASFGKLDSPADATPEQAHFFLAASSQSPLPQTEAFGWLPSAGNILRERQHHIALLEGEVAKKNAWLAEAESAQARLQASYDDLATELRKRNDWATKLDQEMAKARRLMDELNAELQATHSAYGKRISELEAEAAVRLQWVRDLKGTHLAYEKRISELEADASVRLQWVRDLEARIEFGNSEIVRLQDLFTERTAWAQSIEAVLLREREVFYRLREEQEQTALHLERTHGELQGAQTDLQRTQSALQRVRADLNWINGARWVRLGRSMRVVHDRPDDPAE